MKTLLIAVVLMLPLQKVEKKQLETNSHEQQSQQLPAQPAVSPTSVPSHPETEIKNSGTTHKPSNTLCERLWEALVSNWPLVFVGLLCILVAWITLDDIRKQTQNTAIAAKAALESAQAVVNAERAWVVVELYRKYTRDERGYWFSEDGTRLNTTEILAAVHEGYSMRVRNTGRTPAQIISYEIGYTCLAEGVRDLPVGSRGDFIHVEEFNLFLVDHEPIEILPSFDPSDYMLGDLAEITEFKKTAVFHGQVKYRHMFSADECTSEYCYVWTVSKQGLTQVGRHTKYS